MAKRYYAPIGIKLPHGGVVSYVIGRGLVLRLIWINFWINLLTI